MGRGPIHPGEQLTEHLEELNMSAAAAARQLKAPTNGYEQAVEKLKNSHRCHSERSEESILLN